MVRTVDDAREDRYSFIILLLRAPAGRPAWVERGRGNEHRERRALWVAAYEDNTVVRVDLRTREVAATLPRVPRPGAVVAGQRSEVAGEDGLAGLGIGLFDDAPAAHHYIHDRKAIGKVVLVP